LNDYVVPLNHTLENSDYKEDEDSLNDPIQKKYFGIVAKEEFSRMNILSLFLVPFFAVMVTYSQNALKQPTLKNPNYFNLSKKEATNVATQISNVAAFP
jgi:hypothetical protein